MTRLQKDAMKDLLVVLAAALAVGIAYLLTHDLIHSLCWLGLLGFLGILAVFRTAEPGPVIESEEVLPYRIPRILIGVLAPTAIWAMLQGVFLIIYPATRWITWTPSLVIGGLTLLRIWRSRKSTVRKYRVPKYDEREQIVQKNAARVSLAVFWLAFVLWGVAAGILSDYRVWRLPGSTYAFQVLVAMWVVQAVYSTSVLWQERRAGE